MLIDNKECFTYSARAARSNKCLQGSNADFLHRRALERRRQTLPRGKSISDTSRPLILICGVMGNTRDFGSRIGGSNPSRSTFHPTECCGSSPIAGSFGSTNRNGNSGAGCEISPRFLQPQKRGIHKFNRLNAATPPQ